jgi:hypothetical protein
MDVSFEIHAKEIDSRKIITGSVFEQAVSHASGLHCTALSQEDQKILLLGHLPIPCKFAFSNINESSPRGVFEWQALVITVMNFQVPGKEKCIFSE